MLSVPLGIGPVFVGGPLRQAPTVEYVFREPAKEGGQILSSARRIHKHKVSKVKVSPNPSRQGQDQPYQ